MFAICGNKFLLRWMLFPHASKQHQSNIAKMWNCTSNIHIMDSCSCSVIRLMNKVTVCRTQLEYWYGWPWLGRYTTLVCNRATTQPCIPPGSWIGWVKGGNVTSAGWQVTPSDPIWHVNSCNSQAMMHNCYTCLSYPFTYIRFSKIHYTYSIYLHELSDFRRDNGHRLGAHMPRLHCQLSTQQPEHNQTIQHRFSLAHTIHLLNVALTWLRLACDKWRLAAKHVSAENDYFLGPVFPQQINLPFI